MKKICSILLCIVMLFSYIPVGMAAGSNADLSGLTVAGSVYYDLTPYFDAGTIEYTVDVPNDVSSVDVTATTADSSATLKINGAAAASGVAQIVGGLAEGDNPVTVEVTAADGTTKQTYTVTIKRAAAASSLPQTPADYAASDYARYAARMAPGGDHVVVIRPNGTVAAWGDNTYGQCNVPEGLTDVRAVAAGSAYAMALTGDGRVHCWGGYNAAGYETISIPQAVTDVQGSIKLIAAGGVRLAVVTQDNNVIEWKSNSSSAPVVTGDKGNIVAVAANSSAVAVLNDAGSISAWGTSATTGLAGINDGNTVAIEAGQMNFLALKKDGTVAGWGSSSHVSNSNQISTYSNNYKNVRAISGGQFFAAALLADGSVRCWGTTSPAAGNIESGTELMTASAGVKAISTTPNKGALSGADTCVLRGDGTFAVTGPDNCGQTQTPAGMNLVTQPGGSDAGLSSLEATGYSLTPAFDASTTAYTVQVPNNVTSVSVTATAADGNAILKSGALAAWGDCSRTVDLAEGNNLVTVAVTAADGATARTYTLNVKRAASEGHNADLSGLAVAGYDLDPAFDAATYAYTVNIPNSVSSVDITATTAETAATLQINNAAAVSGVAQTVSGLAEGDNQVPVQVTAADGTTVQTYTITVKRAAASQGGNNAALSGLAVAGYDLDPAFDAATYAYTVNVPNNASSVDVTATTADSGATLQINNTAAVSGVAQTVSGLIEGDNPVAVAVTAGDGTTALTYTLTVKRATAALDDNSLAGLTVKSVVYGAGGAQVTTCGIYPALSSGQDEGIVDVGYSVTEVRVTAHPSSSMATLEINGAPAAAGVAASIDGGSLAVGDNLVPVRVTAANGSARDYTLHVKKVSAGYALPPLPQTAAAYQASDYARYARLLGAGSNHSLAIKADGNVVAWGYNIDNQSNVPYGLDDAVAVAAGDSHSLALRADGAVTAWGSDNYGQCAVPAGLAGVADIAAGAYFSAALTGDGRVVAWGRNESGECDLPTGLNGAGNVVDIECGAYHALALKADGTVAAWGAGAGCGVPAGLDHVVAVAAGYSHSMALKDDGSLVIWGVSCGGEKDMSLNLQYVKAIAASQSYAMAVKWDGSLAVWGSPYSYAYYYGKIKGQNVPLELDKKVLAVRANANDDHLLALYEDGTVAGWGNNFQSQCSVPAGLNLFAADTPYTGPRPAIPQTPAAYAASDYVRAASKICNVGNGAAVLNMDGTVKVAKNGRDDYLLVNVPAGLNNVKAISAAGSCNVMALRGDGTVVVWGYDGDGQCQVPESARDVAAIATGGDSGSPVCLALKKDGTVVAWGGNINGICDVPAGLSGVAAISVGSGHCLALKEDGTVAAWGANGAGQCDVPPGLSDVARVFAGKGFSLALKNDGTVAAWGDNSQGECDLPAGLRDVVDIEINNSYPRTCVALKADGTVAVWGENFYGMRNVPPGLHDVAAVSLGYAVFAVKTDGTVVCWGNSHDSRTVNSLAALTGMNRVLDVPSMIPVVIFRDGTLKSFDNVYSEQINEALAGLNVLSGHYFAVSGADLLSPAGQVISSVAAQGGYRVKASVANNYAAPAAGLTIIQVRGGSGATSSGGGQVLGCIGLSGEIPVEGSVVSSDFTMLAGVSGPAYVDVFVWDGWDTMTPRAEANQGLSFSVTQQ
ncbi:MAG: Cadherin-like beta sandwich domain protein [Pelotomaculum sp. PtaU1.Bin065]|nr:MAG: Cadherin-like beta sandwich domain protein [Pelotomaculum sp. PtaU1.Bin065]